MGPRAGGPTSDGKSCAVGDGVGSRGVRCDREGGVRSASMTPLGASPWQDTPPLTRLHWLAAFVCCLALPGLSWLGGSGALAWTMFSTSRAYRLRLEVTTADGQRRLVNPTALAEYTSADVGRYLSGAESWRHGSIGDALGSRLGELCHLACRLPGQPRGADLLLETRRSLDSAVRSSRVNCDCAP